MRDRGEEHTHTQRGGGEGETLGEIGKYYFIEQIGYAFSSSELTGTRKITEHDKVANSMFIVV